jgi:hypothetical protein
MVMARRIFQWLLVAAYALRILIDIIKFMNQLFVSREKKVPVLDAEVFGTGGNAIGVIVWVFGIVASLAIYATALALLFTALFVGFNLSDVVSTVTSNPFTGADAQGLHLLQSIFPVAFAMGLVTAYLAWKASLAGLTLLYNSAQKWLPG